MGQTRLTDDQRERICEWRGAGATLGQIVRRLAREDVTMSESAVSWQLLRMGADLPPARRQSAPADRQPCQRGGRVVRPFTADDDTLLRVLDMQGFARTRIAKRMGRNVSSINGRLATLARHEARAEERF